MVRALRAGLCLALSGLWVGCSTPAPPQLPAAIPGFAPDEAGITGVLFVIGDAGETLGVGNPVLRKLRREVEEWSAALAADSAVGVLFVGDNIYPNGLNPVGHPDRGRDSLRLWNQFRVVDGPAAARYGTPAVFIPGNHDWGGEFGEEGLAFLRREEELFSIARSQGLEVDLIPPANDPGPEVVEIGGAKIVAVDTHLWLELDDDLRRARAVQQVRAAVREPRDRLVVFAAHHPFATGGPHGGLLPFLPSLGVHPMLHRSGTLGQDITALPYQEMLGDFSSAFSGTEALVVYAGGHEHNLQVIERTAPGQPNWTLVSGTGSNFRGVDEIDGTRFMASAPGYMRIVTLDDGSTHLEVVAADGAHQECPSDQYPDYETCLRVGVAAFEVVFRRQLR
jgi:hypothetical protein